MDSRNYREIYENMDEGIAFFRIVMNERNEMVAAVIVVDINGLKEANDTKGHLEGDRLIADTASFLCTITHESLPYRIGGDEFVLLLDNCLKGNLEEYLEKVRMHVNVSVSCGAAWREHACQIDEALKEADAGMYEDKRAYYRNHERRHVR